MACQHAHQRTAIRSADGRTRRSSARQNRLLSVQMRLRNPPRFCRSRSRQASLDQLRVQAGRDAEGSQDARNERNPSLRHLDCHEATVPQPAKQSVAELRRQRNSRMPAMATFVRILLAGYGVETTRAVHRQTRQRSRLFQGELPLGDAQTAKRKQRLLHGARP